MRGTAVEKCLKSPNDSLHAAKLHFSVVKITLQIQSQLNGSIYYKDMKVYAKYLPTYLFKYYFIHFSKITLIKFLMIKNNQLFWEFLIITCIIFFGKNITTALLHTLQALNNFPTFFLRKSRCLDANLRILKTTTFGSYGRDWFASFQKLISPKQIMNFLQIFIDDTQKALQNIFWKEDALRRTHGSSPLNMFWYKPWLKFMTKSSGTRKNVSLLEIFPPRKGVPGVFTQKRHQ